MRGQRTAPPETLIVVAQMQKVASPAGGWVLSHIQLMPAAVTNTMNSRCSVDSTRLVHCRHWLCEWLKNKLTYLEDWVWDGPSTQRVAC